MKIECAMRNEWIDGLVINYSFGLLLKQEQMRTLIAKKIKSSSKIDLKDVLWWMLIDLEH